MKNLITTLKEFGVCLLGLIVFGLLTGVALSFKGVKMLWGDDE